MSLSKLMYSLQYNFGRLKLLATPCMKARHVCLSAGNALATLVPGGCGYLCAVLRILQMLALQKNIEQHKREGKELKDLKDIKLKICGLDQKIPKEAALKAFTDGLKTFSQQEMLSKLESQASFEVMFDQKNFMSCTRSPNQALILNVAKRGVYIYSGVVYKLIV